MSPLSVGPEGKVELVAPTFGQRDAMPPRDNHKKLECWVPRELFDELTDWCTRNNVGSKTAWLEAAIKATLEAEQNETHIYVDLLVNARDAHARNTSGRRGGAEK